MFSFFLRFGFGVVIGFMVFFSVGGIFLIDLNDKYINEHKTGMITCSSCLSRCDSFCIRLSADRSFLFVLSLGITHHCLHVGVCVSVRALHFLHIRQKCKPLTLVLVRAVFFIIIIYSYYECGRFRVIRWYFGTMFLPTFLK